MRKKIVILSSSLRNDSSSDTLARQFAKGARAASGLEGWIECFPKAHFSGIVFGGNATDPKAIQASPDMQKAYEAGRAVC